MESVVHLSHSVGKLGRRLSIILLNVRGISHPNFRREYEWDVWMGSRFAIIINSPHGQPTRDQRRGFPEKGGWSRVIDRRWEEKNLKVLAETEAGRDYSPIPK